MEQRAREMTGLTEAATPVSIPQPPPPALSSAGRNHQPTEMCNLSPHTHCCMMCSLRVGDGKRHRNHINALAWMLPMNFSGFSPRLSVEISQETRVRITESLFKAKLQESTAL